LRDGLFILSTLWSVRLVDDRTISIEALGGEPLVRLIVEETHTCYLGERGRRFDWGYGCGECPACKLRAHGWENYRAGSVRATA
jgi:7-cyano-7-deazaguanine synthase